MERPQVDARELVGRIRKDAAAVPARDPGQAPPAEGDLHDPQEPEAYSETSDLVVPRFRKTFDIPRGGPKAKLRGRIKVLVGKAVFAVLHRYLQDEEHFLTQLTKDHNLIGRQIDEVVDQMADALAEVRRVSEGMAAWQESIEARLKALEDRSEAGSASSPRNA